MLVNLYYNKKDNVIQLVSTNRILTSRYHSLQAELPAGFNPIGKKIKFYDPTVGIRLALICNWGDQCGISTYTKFLIDHLAPKLGDIKIFSENRAQSMAKESYNVCYTWERGHSMQDTVRKVLEWNPSVIMIQHEFGLFPQANFFLPMMEMLSEIPVVTTLHSVYEHRDKSVCTSALKNIIVHSESGKKCLIEKLGHNNSNIDVIPHGCVDFGKVEPLWNYFGGKHPIIQFGFGFNYKGVDVMLDAIRYLKDHYPDFHDVFYCYLCSTNQHVKNINNSYYNSIRAKIEKLELQDNATVQLGFYSDEELNNHLRTGRLAVFPYVTDPKNVVYGCSGAIRIAMANNVPTIVSASHMFDDMQDILPRPQGYQELAEEIHRVFTNDVYCDTLLQKQRDYIKSNTWKITANRYLESLKGAINRSNSNVVMIPKG
jgi:glycosyltransferase involved in cell wall biosynthesis